jgi:hypothetical protein
VNGHLWCQGHDSLFGCCEPAALSSPGVYFGFYSAFRESLCKRTAAAAAAKSRQVGVRLAKCHGRGQDSPWCPGLCGQQTRIPQQPSLRAPTQVGAAAGASTAERHANASRAGTTTSAGTTSSSIGGGGTGGGAGGSGASFGVVGNMVAAAAAGACNQFITMPASVVATRMQVSSVSAGAQSGSSGQAAVCAH